VALKRTLLNTGKSGSNCQELEVINLLVSRLLERKIIIIIIIKRTDAGVVKTA